MIKSKKGKIKAPCGFPVVSAVREKKYDAVLNNFQCLFCRREIHITNLYDSKCGCGSQWFEKLKALEGRRIDAV